MLKSGLIAAVAILFASIALPAYAGQPGPGCCVCFDFGDPCPAAAPVCFTGINVSCTDKCNALGCSGSDAQSPPCDEIPACQVIDPTPALPAPLLSFPALALLLFAITGVSAWRLRRARR
jgi:hypothetical protein